MWLTRTVAQTLQRDFSALYDYLVNRDIVWDGSETRSGRKWMMISQSGDRAFEPDTPDLPVTDMLIEFDNKMRFPHVPHPYPLVPELLSLVTIPRGAGGDGPGALGGRPTKNGNGNGPGRAGAIERRVQLAYSEANNISVLGSEFTHSDLIDAFCKFEKADRVGEVDPCTARRGRWVLIYGILQTLASVSVDAPNIRHSAGVPYHLSPRLKGAKVPPWKSAASTRNLAATQGMAAVPSEASHELSHCWTVPATWNAESSGASGAESTADEETGPSMYNFPRPPTSVAGKSSNAGSYKPAGGSRSVRSSASLAISMQSTGVSPSSTGSVISESDAASNSGRPPRGSRRSRRQRVTMEGLGLRGIEKVNERDWPLRGQRITENGLPFQPGPSTDTGTGGGSPLSDDVADDQRSYRTAVSGNGRDRAGGIGRDSLGDGYGRPLLASGRSSTANMTPLITDFDDLDSVSDALLRG
jgi:hypothetical protein